MPRSKTPDGAKVTKEELKNEAADKRAASAGKGRSIEAFIQAKREEEARNRPILSGDLEVLKNVSDSQLLVLQGLHPNGRPSGEPARLYGWDPQTRTACVLKMAYVEKKAKK